VGQTTTHVNGCNVVIYLDDDGDIPRNISGSTNRIAPNFGHDIGSYRVHGSDWPKRLDGGKDASLTLTVLYTTAADEGFDLLKQWYFATSSGARTLRVDIPDDQIGSDRYSGEVRLDDLHWTVSAEDAAPILVTARLLPDGEISWATIAT
jgi:hypothetical protein